jgi:hypothetical protein
MNRFFGFNYTDFKQKKIQKIRINPPDPPNPFSHHIAFFQSGNPCIPNSNQTTKKFKKHESLFLSFARVLRPLAYANH